MVLSEIRRRDGDRLAQTGQHLVLPERRRYHADGWLKYGGVWYYLYEWGGMANTSWVQVGNTWYYFRGNGAMMTGWLQQGNTWYYLKDSGAMATGWNWVGSKCYYFNASGKMAANTTVGGYKLDASALG